MNPIELKVTFLDETEETVQCIAADLIAFEQRFDLSIARLEAEVRVTHLFFLAWHALKRTGKTKDEFEKWTESVGMVAEASSKK